MRELHHPRRFSGIEIGGFPPPSLMRQGMSLTTSICARCTLGNHLSSRFCVGCGLPLGAAMADSGAGADARGTHGPPEPADPDTSRMTRELVARSGFESAPSGHGWRLIVP